LRYQVRSNVSKEVGGKWALCLKTEFMAQSLLIRTLATDENAGKWESSIKRCDNNASSDAKVAV
jgi:hypothetical protein